MNFPRTAALAMLLSIPAGPNALAVWESYPEFQSLNEEEAERFEGPGILFPDYFLTTLTYRKPPEWEYAWLQHPKSLEIAFGSLNTQRFLMDSRLKIHAPVSSLLEVRFHYFDESDFERRSAHHVIELAFWPWKNLGFSLYGEPSFRKPNDDTGLALLLKPSERHETRLFYSFIDVTRLKYPDGPDRFVEPELPHVVGVVGRLWTPPAFPNRAGDLLEYALRYETPALWEFTDAKYVLRYWRWFASAYARRQFSENQSAAIRFQFDRKHETRDPTGATDAELGDWFTNRLSFFVEATRHDLFGLSSWEGTLGVELHARHWAADPGLAIYRDTLPYARLRIPAWQRRDGSDVIQLGYILSWHREYGLPELGIRPERDGWLEQGFNLSYEFSLGTSGKLALLAAADVDKLGTRRSWGGGSGRLQLFF